MTNAEIAAALEELGTLYERDGADRYRVRAYRTAARAIRDCPDSVAELARAGRVTTIPGIGKTLEEKILTLLETGDIPSAGEAAWEAAGGRRGAGLLSRRAPRRGPHRALRHPRRPALPHHPFRRA